MGPKLPLLRQILGRERTVPRTRAPPMSTRPIALSGARTMNFMNMMFIGSTALNFRAGVVDGGMRPVMVAVAVGGGSRPGNGIFTIGRFIRIRS
jgi:hypothetical protein